MMTTLSRKQSLKQGKKLTGEFFTDEQANRLIDAWLKKQSGQKER